MTDTITLIIHSTGSTFSVNHIQLLASLAEQYGATIRILNNSFQLVRVPLSKKEEIIAALPPELKLSSHRSVNSVTMCRGKTGCPHGLQDAYGTGFSIDETFYGRPTASKIRIAISGCPRCCAEPHTKDIGFFGKKDGYTLLVGGMTGHDMRKATDLNMTIPENKILHTVENILQWYSLYGKEKERFYQTFERLGSSHLSDFLTIGESK